MFHLFVFKSNVFSVTTTHLYTTYSTEFLPFPFLNPLPFLYCSHLENLTNGVKLIHLNLASGLVIKWPKQGSDCSIIIQNPLVKTIDAEVQEALLIYKSHSSVECYRPVSKHQNRITISDVTPLCYFAVWYKQVLGSSLGHTALLGRCSRNTSDGHFHFFSVVEVTWFCVHHNPTCG